MWLLFTYFLMARDSEASNLCVGAKIAVLVISRVGGGRKKWPIWTIQRTPENQYLLDSKSTSFLSTTSYSHTGSRKSYIRLLHL